MNLISESTHIFNWITKEMSCFVDLEAHKITILRTVDKQEKKLWAFSDTPLWKTMWLTASRIVIDRSVRRNWMLLSGRRHQWLCKDDVRSMARSPAVQHEHFVVPRSAGTSLQLQYNEVYRVKISSWLSLKNREYTFLLFLWDHPRQIKILK